MTTCDRCHARPAVHPTRDGRTICQGCRDRADAVLAGTPTVLMQVRAALAVEILPEEEDPA